MHTFAKELQQKDLTKSAIVFAPHPDDETLGCGGTIIKKKKLGANLKIIFMTDGCHSHSNLISATELKSIRAREALGASRILGVHERDVIFLNFEDGKLKNNMESAVAKVTEILFDHQPQVIFSPYYKDRDPNLDHIATAEIVRLTLQRYSKRLIVYEYPIWFWWVWPWVTVPRQRHSQTVTIIKKIILATLTLLRDFTSSVYIGDTLELKYAALKQHKSQMTKLRPDARWTTLGDLANGQFLECFFQKYEIFHRYKHPEE